MESSNSRRSWVRGRRIGSGAFGTVNLAFHESNGEAFAVKSVPLNCPNHASILALDNEIRILSSLASPYIVEYLGEDTSPACRNLHMEYMPGGSLADLAAAAKKKNCQMDEMEVRKYTRCIARALRYLHAVAGVVHCDVKGRNVLLGRAPGVAKLADFGAAVRINSDVGGRNWARGTPLWMAPEVARGERPRPESDVWSLGCTVIEIVTGAPPWVVFKPQDGAEAAVFRIGYSDELPEFPPRLSKLGRDFLDKCLRREAVERWTAEQLLRHPFLAEAGAEDSPRGVLEWANSEFGDAADSGDGENCSVDYSSIEHFIDLMACGRGRVRELASCGGGLGWDSDGWEEVRSAGEVNWAGDGTEEVHVKGRGREGEGEGICWGYSNWFSVGLEDRDGGVSERVTCSVASAAAASCYCCSCNGGLVCHHGIGVHRKLFFGWCCLLLRIQMKVNAIISFSFSFGLWCSHILHLSL